MVLVILLAVLPPVLLLLGVGLGVVASRWWASHRSAAADGCDTPTCSDVEAAVAAPALSIALPPGRKASSAKLQGGGAIHVVACSASLQPIAVPAPGGSPFAGRRQRPAALRTPDPTQPDAGGEAATAEEQLRSLVGGGMGGSGSLSPGGVRGHHRKTTSMDLGQLVRAGPSIISQVGWAVPAECIVGRFGCMVYVVGGYPVTAAPGGPVHSSQPLSPQPTNQPPGDGGLGGT